MFLFELFRSEASAANLLQQVRWRDGLYCPRCQSESVIKHGSFREYQRYLCKDCDRTIRLYLWKFCYLTYGNSATSTNHR